MARRVSRLFEEGEGEGEGDMVVGCVGQGMGLDVGAVRIWEGCGVLRCIEEWDGGVRIYMAL